MKERKIKNPLFLSCEPLMEEITLKNKSLDWLIIGGESTSSGMPAGQPQWEWVIKLYFQVEKLGLPYYAKPNLEVRPQRYPSV